MARQYNQKPNASQLRHGGKSLQDHQD